MPDLFCDCCRRQKSDCDDLFVHRCLHVNCNRCLAELSPDDSSCPLCREMLNNLDVSQSVTYLAANNIEVCENPTLEDVKPYIVVNFTLDNAKLIIEKAKKQIEVYKTESSKIKMRPMFSDHLIKILETRREYFGESMITLEHCITKIATAMENMKTVFIEIIKFDYSPVNIKELKNANIVTNFIKFIKFLERNVLELQFKEEDTQLLDIQLLHKSIGATVINISFEHDK